MKINSEAIYETYPWKKYGEGPTKTASGHFTDTNRSSYTSEDFRFTFKNGVLYAFCMKWPEDGVVHIHSLGHYVREYCASITGVTVLGAKKTSYQMCSEYLSVTASEISTKNPVVIKITLE